MSGFRLAALLRVRRLQQDAAAGRAGAAASRARAAEALVVERATALGACAPPHTGDEATWRAAVAARTAMSSLLTESRGLALARQEEAAAARAEWAAARTRVRPLERLAERADAEAAAAAQRAEQVLLDEHASRAAGPVRASTARPRPEGGS